jgi:hypothetical protein
MTHDISRHVRAQFSVGPETEYYRLSVQGFTDYGIGDSMTPHDRMFFSTYDFDNDRTSANCAQLYQGTACPRLPPSNSRDFLMCPCNRRLVVHCLPQLEPQR